MESFVYTTGKTALYLYPAIEYLKPLSSWVTYRILATEESTPDFGKYTFTPNPLVSTYYLFDGASQPASWSDAVEIIDELDDEGKKIGTKEIPKYQGIDTSFLVATLTAAIQELNAKVDAQSKEIQLLKGAK